MNKIKYKSVYILLFIYIFIEYFLVKNIPYAFNMVINPLFLIATTVYTYFLNGSVIERTMKNKDAEKNMVIIMISYFILYEAVGLILGFVKNPYSLTFIGIIKNIWHFLVPIIFIEITRNTIVEANKNSKLGLILITIIFFFVELNLYSIETNAISREKTFIFLAANLVPLFSFECLYTYLCYKGTNRLVLIHRILYQSITLFFPIAPNLDWFGTGIIGILFPVILYLLFKFYYEKRQRYAKRKRIKKKNPAVFIPVFILVLLLAGFMLGIFDYLPIAVASDSMNPIFYRGDAVVMRKIDKEMLKNIKKGDIIVFRMDNKRVIHRVIDIQEDGGSLYFQTKGDNNDGPDNKMVPQNNIDGLYSFSIKYIGYPSIWLSEFIKKDKAPDVELGK